MIRALDMKTVSDDGRWVVSTVALVGSAPRVFDTPLNPERAPEAFETMVFEAGPDSEPSDYRDHYRCGYAEITEARIGHGITVAALNAGQLDMY
jgi:hypothetical protein